MLTVEDRGKGPEVRLAHEALIENWPRAQTIISESANFIRVRDDIEGQRRKWEAAQRRPELLLPGGLARCEFCNFAVDKFERSHWRSVTWEQARDVIDIAVNNHIGYMPFVGGEPLAHKDLRAMVRYAAERGIRPLICTSGPSRTCAASPMTA